SGGWCSARAGTTPAPGSVSSAISDPSHEPARAHPALRVEALLDPAHQAEGVAGRPPGVDLPLEVERGLDHHQAPPTGRQPLPGVGDPPDQPREERAVGPEVALAGAAGQPED